MGRIGPDELARLFDQHAAGLVLYARQWCDRPEDVVQDAFLALARQRRLPDRPAAWLHTVVRNGALGAIRADRRRRRREEQAAAPADSPWFAATGTDPDDRLDAELAALRLGELGPEAREVVVARLWGGLTFEEIAKLQGCSLTTAHRRYHDALARLHERLDSPCRTTTDPNRPS